MRDGVAGPYNPGMKTSTAADSFAGHTPMMQHYFWGVYQFKDLLRFLSS